MELAHVKIRAIIFDLYGTLLEVGPPPPDADARWQCLFREFLNAKPSLSRLDFSVAARKVVARIHESARTRGISWPEVCWSSVVAQILPELHQLSRKDQDEFILRQIQTGHTTHVAQGTAAALRWLKQRQYPLGIASNAQAYSLREFQEGLAAHQLELNLFEKDLSFWSFENGFSKPDPHVFQLLTARLAARGITPPETLMVGDRADNDIAPARAHGWQTWRITSLPTPDGRDEGHWNQLANRLA